MQPASKRRPTRFQPALHLRVVVCRCLHISSPIRAVGRVNNNNNIVLYRIVHYCIPVILLSVSRLVFRHISLVFSIMYHPSFVFTCLLIILLCASKSNSSSFSTALSSSSVQTATAQFSTLNVIPISFFFTSPRYTNHKVNSCSLVILLILCGDIHLNPGPCTNNTFNICTLNIRSLLNPLKFTAISDLAESRHIDLFALTETWITSSSTTAEILNATPPGFTLISCPRPAPTVLTKSHIVGGGTAFLIREPTTLLSTPSQTFKSFEMSSVTLKLFKSNLTVFNVYRPPPATTKTRKPVSFSDFLTDLDTLLSLAATTPHEFLITGDFNLHLDESENPQVKQFLSALNSTNLTQHVSFPTHRDHHILDLVITATSSSLSPIIDHSPVSPSDHFPIFSTLTISPLPPPPSSEISFRCFKSISITKLTRDILNSRLITHPPTNLSDLVDSYNTTLSSLLDKHAPLKTKTIHAKPRNPWFTPALSKLKSARRHLEKIWLRTRSSHDIKTLRTATNSYHSAIIHAKKVFNSSLISSSSAHPRKLWNSINKLLRRKAMSQLPSTIDSKSLPHMFANFFSNKVLKLHSALKSHFTTTSPHMQPSLVPTSLTSFSPVTDEEIFKIISLSSNSFCDLDPIPTSILKQCIPTLLPTITNIVNLSLSTGVFPKQFKLSSVIPLLKKYNLDKEELSNYRPISHLSFLSKLTEGVVKQRLTDHLSSEGARH
jgi:exonuclease III